MAVSGFFKVAFSALLPGAGGLVAVENGKVRGGDGQYLYSGAVTEANGSATAVLRVKAHAPNASNVFGGHSGGFTLNLSGTVTATGFTFSGPSPLGSGPNIQIIGTRVASIDLI